VTSQGKLVAERDAPDTFYAIEPRWLGPDRFYKLYLTPAGIRGAYVAGQFGQRREIDAVMRNARLPALLMRRWVSGVWGRRMEAEARYDAMSGADPAFLAADRRNFSIDRSQIERFTLSGERSWWNALNNIGTLELRLRGGQRRRFLLALDQDLEHISRILHQVLDPQIARTAPGATE
jgi:hypothetical protein